MRYTPGGTGEGCHCDTCTTVRNITSWGANSSTIGQGSTEQNGNWEVLSNNLHVTTGDAIITWDAGISDWQLRFDTSGISWNIPGSLATDYTKSLRLVYNFVDNNNFDFVAIRKSSTANTYYVSFCERVAGVESVLHPVAGGGGSVSQQFRIQAQGFFASVLSFIYKDEVLHVVSESGNNCFVGGQFDGEWSARTLYRPRVNNIIGIATDPTWTGNVDINTLIISSPGATPCSSVSSNCWFPTRPAGGATNNIVAKTITATIAGTPYTCYPGEFVADDYNWFSSGSAVTVTLQADGDIEVISGGNSWLLTNGGADRTDADAWTSLNIPPVAPNVQICTITGNY